MEEKKLRIESYVKKSDFLAKMKALFALPARFRKTGSMFFITDQSGDVYAKFESKSLFAYPHNSGSENWTRIDSVEALSELQNKHHVSMHEPERK